MSRRSSRTVALLSALATFATSALAQAQDIHVVGVPLVTGAPIQFHRLPWPSTPVVVQGMIQDDYSGQPLNSGCVSERPEYVAGFAFKSEGTVPFIRVPAHEMSETDVPLVTIPATTRIARRANGTHWRMPRTHAESQTSGNYSHGTTDSVSSSSTA